MSNKLNKESIRFEIQGSMVQSSDKTYNFFNDKRSQVHTSLNAVSKSYVDSRQLLAENVVITS